jgi:hypothetical protein
MSAEMQFIRCSKCDADIDESPSTDPHQRVPCPKCGSTGRKFGVGISAQMTVRGMLQYRGRRGGIGRPFVEGKVGSDFQRSTGRWVRLERAIDRARDWYRERISDPKTGEVIRHVEQPLSEHRGHGAARRPGSPETEV